MTLKDHLLTYLSGQGAHATFDTAIHNLSLKEAGMTIENLGSVTFFL